jgi:thioredoxin reductase
MPRGALLEYMLARVTKNCPDIFEKYVQFQTSVVKVVYDEEIAKFRVMTRSLLTGVARTDIFDRCIWAAGEDGKPKMPKGVLKKLDRFSGKVMHSTDTASFKEDVFGKRVLIVGGSYSAEDLALMACKVGVERVYVCCRAGVVGDPAVLWTENWPHDKVEVFEEKTLVRVENSSTVILQETECIRDDNYEINKKGQEVRLEDIDTIILCTGYHQQLDMLEPKLKDWTQNEKTATFPVPADWRMNENRFSPLVGEVAAPAEARYYGTSVHNCELYRGLLIDNPRMMFLRHDQEDYPILNIDVMAWLFVQVCTGRRQIFSAAEMRQKNVEQALSEMKMLPTVRFHTDVDYAEAYEEAAEEKDPEWELFDESLEDEFRASFHTMARIMVEANYPLCIGSYTELNEKGRKLHEYAVLSVEHRSNATASTTFRDTTDSHKFTSIFTGTAAVPLKKAWLEIDENKDKDIV